MIGQGREWDMWDMDLKVWVSQFDAGQKEHEGPLHNNICIVSTF